jgi:electron transfer flavoprotein beta subunit
MLRVVVPVKQAAALDDDFELEDGATNVDPDYLDLDLNEWDNFAVEAAVQIKEAAGEAEVVVVTVGDEDSEDALLACLAKGADRAIRIWDEGFDDPEPLLIASVLAPAVAREAPALVLCGVQSSDAASSATGVALAAMLGLPHVAVVRRLELRPEDGTALVDRELEGGLVEQLSVPTPALLTIQTGSNEPRYANLRAIKQAASKPLMQVGLAELGLDAEDLTSARGARTVALRPPPKRGGGASMLEGDVAAIADRIVAIMDESVPDRNGAGA